MRASHKVYLSRRRPCWLCSKQLRQMQAGKYRGRYAAAQVEIDGYSRYVHVQCAERLQTETDSHDPPDPRTDWLTKGALALLLVTLTACGAGISSIPAVVSHPAGEAMLSAVASTHYTLTTSAADKARDRHIDDLLDRCAMDPQWRVDAVVLERCQAFAGARDDEAMRELEAAVAAARGRR